MVRNLPCVSFPLRTDGESTRRPSQRSTVGVFKTTHSSPYNNKNTTTTTDTAEAELHAFENFMENDRIIDEHNAKGTFLLDFLISGTLFSLELALFFFAHSLLFLSVLSRTRTFFFFVHSLFLSNSNTQKPGLSYTLGHNEFSDLSWDEFQAVYVNGLNGNPHLRRPKNYVDLPKASSDSVDWVSKGAVTPVKNQGQCGSCWAFSTTGSFEGAYQVATGNLVSFSEQNLVSCDTVDDGCSGGLMDNAFGWIKSNGGLCTEDDYPYTSGSGSSGSCKTSCSKAATLTGWSDVKQGDEDALKSAVEKGPVSVAIEADKSVFQLYSGGVFTSAEQCGTQLDHGVLVVGYGM